jgi:hypothetical protein
MCQQVKANKMSRCDGSYSKGVAVVMRPDRTSVGAERVVVLYRPRRGLAAEERIAVDAAGLEFLS